MTDYLTARQAANRIGINHKTFVDQLRNRPLMEVRRYKESGRSGAVMYHPEDVEEYRKLIQSGVKASAKEFRAKTGPKVHLVDTVSDERLTNIIMYKPWTAAGLRELSV